GIAAILFLITAGADVGKRQNWMFAVLAQDFRLQGLPVDDKEKDVEGRPLVNLMSKRMQEQLGVSEVTTQKDEVARRRKALGTEIEAAADEDAKRKLLENALVPLARNWGQRDDLQRKIRDRSVTMDSLLGP